MSSNSILEDGMKKKLVALFLATTCIMCGCGNLDMALDNKASENETANEDDSNTDISDDDKSEDDNTDTSDADKSDKDKDGSADSSEEDETATSSETSEDVSQTDYRVIYFFEEEIESIPVSITKVSSSDDGDVYSYDIVYDDQSFEYDMERDRFNIGTFLFKDDEIYVSTSLNYESDEQDYLDSSVLVYSDEDYTDEVEGYDVKLHNDGNLCKFTLSNNRVESGYYMEYIFNSDKELVYFRSGYGAERDPIEITLFDTTSIEDAFSDAEDVDLTKEDVSISYNGLDIGPDTTYQEIIDAYSYPENFEDNNNGFISSENGYRWQLQYPDQSDYDYDVRIVCVSPSMEPEGPDTYIDFVYFGIPTKKGVTERDSIYTLAQVYGAPDDIREAACPEYTDIVYEFDGNELIFTILPDNTIVYMRIDFDV
jgi:hypothetical protein